MSAANAFVFLPSAALNQTRGIWTFNRVEDDNSGLWTPSYVALLSGINSYQDSLQCQELLSLLSSPFPYAVFTSWPLEGR
jgi:hypothetical protein